VAGGGLDQASRWRLLCIGAVLTIFGALVAQRLYWYQVTDHETFTALASEEHAERLALPPVRGEIIDSTGHPLAMSVRYSAIDVYRPEVFDMEKTSRVLADSLGLQVDDVRAKILAADKQWTSIATRVPASASSQIEAAGLRGVRLRPSPTREYPEGSTAAQAMGFVGVDGHGLSGLELTFDQELAGQAGVVITERDTIGDEIAIGRKALVPAVPGSDLVLTIDRYVQHVAEREIAAAVQQNKAVGGQILVMDPATGAILAMASVPTYSLTSDAGIAAGQVINPVAVTDTYEPGSVMKLVTMSGAIEDGTVTPNTHYLDRGIGLDNGVPIHNWDGGAYGDVTIREILIHSLNTGTQWVASKMGAERYYHYVDLFGFGQPTGVRLNGEAAGAFRHPDDVGWSRADLATNSYGQSISVTPLQMITAVAALGNGGVLMQPQIVREIRRPGGTETVQPKQVRQAVSAQTAATMLDMMESVWDQEAFDQIRPKGYRLAAKSGTADIPGPGGYGTGKTIASFIGFGPIPNPRFVILVRLDEPEAIYGGVVAAPVFRNVAADLLAYYHVPPLSTPFKRAPQ
jgi:cell division protein FtsI/penicillin-binding protein 2